MAKLRFGRHVGQDITDTPTSYLRWILREDVCDLLDDYRTPMNTAALSEFRRRQRVYAEHRSLKELLLMLGYKVLSLLRRDHGQA